MFIFFNTENEIKLRTDREGLLFAEDWLIKQTQQNSGVTYFTRDHFYYDVPGHLLSFKGASFRRSVKKPSYCFKYLVNDRPEAIVRREVFTKCPNYFLDQTNAIHRRTPVMARLRHFLETECDAELGDDLGPVLRISCSRRYRIIWQPNGDRLVGVAFDTVSAKWFDEAGSGVQWCEIELETGANMPEGIITADRFANELASCGLQRTTVGKYATALQLLHDAA